MLCELHCSWRFKKIKMIDTGSQLNGSSKGTIMASIDEHHRRIYFQISAKFNFLTFFTNATDCDARLLPAHN